MPQASPVSISNPSTSDATQTEKTRDPTWFEQTPLRDLCLTIVEEQQVGPLRISAGQLDVDGWLVLEQERSKLNWSEWQLLVTNET